MYLFLLLFTALTLYSCNTLEDTLLAPTFHLIHHASLSPELLLRESDGLLTLLVFVGTSAVVLFARSYAVAHPRHTLFMLYLALFGAFMLTLLQSNDMFLLFAAWEGIGVVSYTLISYTHTRFDSLRSGYKAM